MKQQAQKRKFPAEARYRACFLLISVGTDTSMGILDDNSSLYWNVTALPSSLAVVQWGNNLVEVPWTEVSRCSTVNSNSDGCRSMYRQAVKSCMWSQSSCGRWRPTIQELRDSRALARLASRPISQAQERRGGRAAAFCFGLDKLYP